MQYGSNGITSAVITQPVGQEVTVTINKSPSSNQITNGSEVLPTQVSAPVSTEHLVNNQQQQIRASKSVDSISSEPLAYQNSFLF